MYCGFYFNSSLVLIPWLVFLLFSHGSSCSISVFPFLLLADLLDPSSDISLFSSIFHSDVFILYFPSALMDDDDKNTPRSQDGLIAGMKNTNSTEPHQGKTRGGDVEEGGLITSLEKTTNDLPSPAVTAKGISIEGLVSNKIEGGADGVEAKHEEEEEEEDILGFWYAIVWLAIITVFISFLSDALVLSIDIASVDWHVSGVFLSTIVIPIIGEDIRH